MTHKVSASSRLNFLSHAYLLADDMIGMAEMVGLSSWLSMQIADIRKELLRGKDCEEIARQQEGMVMANRLSSTQIEGLVVAFGMMVDREADLSKVQVSDLRCQFCNHHYF